MKLRKAINHKIVIEPSANEGFIAMVGCGTFVFGDKDSLVAGLEEYLNNPEKWEKVYAMEIVGAQSEAPVEDCPRTINEGSRVEGEPDR